MVASAFNAERLRELESDFVAYHEQFRAELLVAMEREYLVTVGARRQILQQLGGSRMSALGQKRISVSLKCDIRSPNADLASGSRMSVSCQKRTLACGPGGRSERSVTLAGRPCDNLRQTSRA